MGEFVYIFALHVGIYDFVDMLSIHAVPCLFLAELLAGINEKDTAVHIVFLEDDDTGRNACIEEYPCRQAYDCVYAAIFQQMLADRALGGPTEQYAMGKHDAHGSIILQMVEAMQEEGKICFCLGSQLLIALEPWVGEESFDCAPMLAVGRIHNGGIIIGRLVRRPVSSKGIAIAEVLIGEGDIMQDHIHTSQVVGCMGNLLPEILHVVAAVLIHVATGVKKQGAGAHARVVNRKPRLPLFPLRNDTGDQLGHC